MKFTEFVLIMLFVFLSACIFGQEDHNAEKREQQKHSIGLQAGFTTGFGLAYRYMPKKVGIQTTILILPNNYYSSFGASVLFKVIERQNSWFYLYQSNLYSTYRTSGFNCGCPYYEWFNGFGFGTEIYLGKYWGLNFMGGAGFYQNFYKFTVSGEAGIYFKF